MTFFGESFLEGFLGFYGLEVDNALDSYEHNLHVLETQELGQSSKFVSRKICYNWIITSIVTSTL